MYIFKKYIAELPTLTVSPCDTRFCMFSHALTPHIQFLTPKKNQILGRDASLSRQETHWKMILNDINDIFYMIYDIN